MISHNCDNGYFAPCDKFKISKSLNFWNSNFKTCRMSTKMVNLKLNDCVEIIWKLIREAIINSLIQHFKADFLWKVSLKILNSGLILKTFIHVMDHGWYRFTAQAKNTSLHLEHSVIICAVISLHVLSHLLNLALALVLKSLFYVCADWYIICALFFLQKCEKSTIICAFKLRGF